MKFAGQPYGATMQPPADTPGAWTPGDSVLSAARGIDTPFAPFLESFFSMLGFMNFAGGRVSPLAVAIPVMAMTSAHASATTTPGLKRIDPPSIGWGRALPQHARVLNGACPSLRRSNENV